jgi:hypothetical protein
MPANATRSASPDDRNVGLLPPDLRFRRSRPGGNAVTVLGISVVATSTGKLAISLPNADTLAASRYSPAARTRTIRRDGRRFKGTASCRSRIRREPGRRGRCGGRSYGATRQRLMTARLRTLLGQHGGTGRDTEDAARAVTLRRQALDARAASRTSCTNASASFSVMLAGSLRREHVPTWFETAPALLRSYLTPPRNSGTRHAGSRKLT